ncbi:MAG: 3-deoxy-D-manno-octulosonic acid transferase [Opitutus sp.]|nr:3-deoxy-D-manno-octulosonic acid transferase [Opitutus sp.]
MIWVYRLLFLPALLLASPYFLWRMRKRGGYASGFSHRFGEVPDLPPKAPGAQRVWLQAVSVGEMLAIGPLLEGLRREGLEIYLTTTTSTGYALAKEKYAALTVGLGYFPLDFWAFSARAWRRVQPDLCVLMEGERWPEHIRAAQRHGVPVVCVNARLSDRSFRRSAKFAWAVRATAGSVAKILCAAKRDEQRFRALGFPAAKLVTTGNLKLDVSIPLLAAAAKAALRREVGLPADGLVLLGSSTWPGEEEALVEALKNARARGLRVSLLLVPRHAERRDALRTLLAGSGLSHHFRSEGSAPAAADVVVGDTTGELRQLTQLADLVFVGKSLSPHDGGQTPVEAAILGKPVLHGPAMTNFRDIVRSLTEAAAVRRVETHADLVRVAVELLGDTARRDALAASAREWSAANRGATERTLAEIKRVLG